MAKKPKPKAVPIRNDDGTINLDVAMVALTGAQALGKELSNAIAAISNDGTLTGADIGPRASLHLGLAMQALSDGKQSLKNEEAHYADQAAVRRKRGEA